MGEVTLTAEKFTPEYQKEVREVIELYGTRNAIPLRAGLQTIDRPERGFEMIIYNQVDRKHSILGSMSLDFHRFRLIFQAAEGALADLMAASTPEWRNKLYGPLKNYLKPYTDAKYNPENLNHSAVMSAVYAQDDTFGKEAPIVKNCCVIVEYDGKRVTEACLYLNDRAFVAKFKKLPYGWKALLEA